MQDWLNDIMRRVVGSTPDDQIERWKRNRERKAAKGGITKTLLTPEERLVFEDAYGPARWSVELRSGVHHYRFEGFYGL